MKKKAFISLVLAGMMTVGFFAACNNGNGGDVAIAYADGTSYAEKANFSTVGTDLFRRNEFETPIADPSVLKITDLDYYGTDVYGSYYLYGTTGGSTAMECFQSKDLTNWEYKGKAYAPDPSTELGQATASLIWATEVIYDENTDKYYALFSASEADVEKEESKRLYIAYCAVSDSPAGPFEVITNANNETRNTEATKKISDSYSLFNNDELVRWGRKTFGGNFRMRNGLGQTTDHVMTIDLHPFIDPVNNKKYLYFKMQGVYNINGRTRDVIAGVEMETWIKPKYDTLSLLAVAGYTDATCSEGNSYEDGTPTNEGGFVNYHNGKYYLTVSVFGYESDYYAVWQAVSDTPLGTYRKLTEAEGGLLLSTDGATRSDMFATGHHALLEVDDKMYIVYHAYQINDYSGATRYVMADEVKWVTIEDKDGNPLDVMYVNGPTSSVTPKFEFASEYKNLAQSATITATGLASGSDKKWLNDGLYSINKNTNQDFIAEYVQEAAFDGEAKITVDLGSYKTVRGLMVFNSNDYFKAFQNVKKVEMQCKLANGQEFTAKIDNLKFDWKAYARYDDFGEISDIIPGSSALAEFDEMLVKKITFTVEKPADYDTVNIAEIVVLGRDGNPKTAANNTSAYVDTYKPEQEAVEEIVYDYGDGIVIDGDASEAAYNNLTWHTYTVNSGTEVIKTQVSTCFGEKGIYFVFKNDGKSLWYNAKALPNMCTGVELYISRSDVATTDKNAYCLSMSVDGRITYKLAQGIAWNYTYLSGGKPVCAVQIDGQANVKGAANGYVMELYVPFEIFGLTAKPTSIATTMIVNNQTDVYCSGSTRHHYNFGKAEGVILGWGRYDPTTWTKWGANGLISVADDEPNAAA